MNPATMPKAEIVSRLRFRCSHRHNGLEHHRCYDAIHDTERIGFLDIEATHLKATFGYMLTYCIKRRGGDTIQRRVTPEDQRKQRFDKPLCVQFLRDIEEFDRLVTYYGTGYDLPFIRSRCMYWGLDFPPMGSIFHTDVYYTVRNKLKLHRSSLEVACDHLGIEAKGHRITPKVWLAAGTGDKSAIDYIMQHNLEDVISLEALWSRLQGQFRTTKTST